MTEEKLIKTIKKSKSKTEVAKRLGFNSRNTVDWYLKKYKLTLVRVTESRLEVSKGE